MNLVQVNSLKIYFFIARARIKNALLAIFLVPALGVATPLTFSQASSDLQNSAPGRRFAAIQAMKNFSDEGAAVLLSNALATEKEQHLQAAIMDSLASLHDPAVIPSILPFLSTKNIFVRQHAAYAVGLIGGRDAEKALMSALPQEKNTFVRSTELMGLSLCGSSASVPVIQAALSDSKMEVRAQAIQALRRIPGKTSVMALAAHSESDSNLKRRVQEALQEKASEVR